MLPVLLALSIWVTALLGLGSTARGFFFERKERPGSAGGADEDTGVALSGFSGLMALSVIGTLFNFILPVSTWISCILAAAGIALFLRRRKELGGTILPFEAMVLLGFLGFLSFAASGPVTFFDTGLYHLQAVSWTTSGPVPLGLANLHRRLGLNSSWFPAAALLELPGLEGRSPSLAAPLVLFFFGAAVVSAMRRCLAGEATVSRLFLSLGVVPVFLFSADTSVPSLSTDLPVTLLTILSAYFLIRRGENPGDAAAPRAAVLLALFAATVKISAGAWLLACLAATRVLPAAAAGVLVVPWLMRGVALSGCLLYPSLATRIGALPWAVAPRLARAEILWARSWGRLPGGSPEETLRGWAWVMSWLRANVLRPSIVPLEIFVLAGIACLFLAARKRSASFAASRRAVTVPALVASFSLVVWFVSAPDTRFAWGSLFTIAALLLSTGLREVSSKGWPASALLFLFTFSAGSLFVASLVINGRRGGQTFLARPPLFVPPVADVKTLEGVTVHRPAEGDRCGTAPLPCTPDFDPALRITRAPGGRWRSFALPKRG